MGSPEKTSDYRRPFRKAFPEPFVAERQLRFVITMVPFPSYDNDWARAETAKPGTPLSN